MTDKKSAYSRFLDGDKSGMEEIVREYNSPLIFFINGYVKNLCFGFVSVGITVTDCFVSEIKR